MCVPKRQLMAVISRDSRAFSLVMSLLLARLGQTASYPMSTSAGPTHILKIEI